MNRRNFMKATAATAALSATPGFTGPNMSQRPNLLWIMTDQQPADVMSCAGNPDVSTPAMDQLAAKGLRFERAYCTNPICVPSRGSMMTGLMPHETGVTFNMDRFDMQGVSAGRLLSDAGYDTGYIGKWHIPMSAENSEWHGFDVMMEGTREFNDQHVARPAVDFIQRERQKPYFLVASFNNPHDICEWARRATGGFPERRVDLWNGEIPEAPAPQSCPELPENFGIPDGEPDIIRTYQTWQPGTYPVREWPDERWRQYRWAMNRFTERVDAEIAKILDVVDDNTIILFTSDHGDGNGAHRWNQKTLFYEESARVPLILSGPGIPKAGQVDPHHLASIGLDILPTLCDYAGVAVPEELRGKSLRPLAENRNVPWRTYLVSENDLSPAYGVSAGIEGRMLRTAKYKYVVYSAGRLRERLTDMEQDPGEMVNLATDPEYQEVLKEHRVLLARDLAETRDAFIVPGISKDGWMLSPSI